MIDTSDEHIGDERCTDMFLAVNSGLQIYSYTGRKYDTNYSLTRRTYFQCSRADAGTGAGMNTVPMVSAY